MPTFSPLRLRVPGYRVGLLFLAFTHLPAEELTLSVNSHVSPACRTIAAPVLQEAIETQLQGAGFPLAKAHNASLASEVECTPVNPQGKSPRTVLHQCVSVSQAVSLSAEVRAALATTWRKCESYTCAARNCEAVALTGARDLVDTFVSEQRERSARELKAVTGAVTGAVTTLDRAAGTTRSSDLTFFYYSFYIMTCVAVLFRWQWYRYAH